MPTRNTASKDWPLCTAYHTLCSHGGMFFYLVCLHAHVLHLCISMATFLAAFLLMCFVRATVVVRLIVAVSTALILGLILWCIWTFWEETGVHWRKSINALQSWLTEKISGKDLPTSQQGDHQYDTESKHDNNEMNDNGTDHGYGTSSTEQYVGHGDALYSWPTCIKYWWRDRRSAMLKGESQLSRENNSHA